MEHKTCESVLLPVFIYLKGGISVLEAPGFHARAAEEIVLLNEIIAGAI